MAGKSRPGRSDATHSSPDASGQSVEVARASADDDPMAARDWPVERREAENRRKSAWRSFLYGNFRPRRRNSRRESDQHHLFFDWHEPRILYLALGVLLLSCTDALFTLNLINIGASEGNALMASMLAGGVDQFVISKTWLTSLSVVILVVVARRRLIGSFNVEHLLQFFCAGYALLICYEVYLFAFVFELEIF